MNEQPLGLSASPRNSVSVLRDPDAISTASDVLAHTGWIASFHHIYLGDAIVHFRRLASGVPTILALDASLVFSYAFPECGEPVWESMAARVVENLDCPCILLPGTVCELYARLSSIFGQRPDLESPSRFLEQQGVSRESIKFLDNFFMASEDKWDALSNSVPQLRLEAIPDFDDTPYHLLQFMEKLTSTSSTTDSFSVGNPIAIAHAMT